MKKTLAIMASLGALAIGSVPAHAVVTTYSSLASWQSAVGTYNRDTAYGENFSDIKSLTLDDGTTLGFGSEVNIRTIGSGWATWSGGYTGQALYTNGATTLTASLSPVGALGLFVEPNPFSVHTFKLHMSDGSEVSGSYDGSGGAGFLGFVGGGITGFEISSDVDFAFGDFYTAGVPEPATWAFMILGFGLVGAAMRRRQKAAVRFAF